MNPFSSKDYLWQNFSISNTLYELLNNFYDILLILGPDSQIVFINKAYCEIFKINRDKLLGKRLDTIEPNAQALYVLQTGHSVVNQKEYLHSVQTEVFGSCFPIKDSSGQIMGCFAMFYNQQNILDILNQLEQTTEIISYLQDEIDAEQKLPQSFDDYIGQNKTLKKRLLVAAKASATTLPILIEGESGVGKEVLAKAIWKSGNRSDKPFIKINCAAIPAALMESELFGYESGAFTGAQKGGKKGKLELAHTGTVFLDEIGDMDLALQAKLLRAIQEKELEKIGREKPITVDIRFIAATNRNLKEMVAAGTFRLDLYYRLNTVRVFLPPLRERMDDLPELCNFFLAQNAANTPAPGISTDTYRVFRQYDWPGNIRELQNVLLFANMMRTGNTIYPKDLPEYINRNNIPDSDDRQHPSFKEAIAAYEKQLIEEALQKTKGNRSAAIARLGLSRKAFYEKLAKYNIK